MPGQRLLRGTGMAQQVTYQEVPYRYRGRPDWPPEAPAEEPRPRHTGPHQERMAARLAEFTRLREDNVPVTEAGERVGVRRDMAQRYERRRKQALAKAEGDGK